MIVMPQAGIELPRQKEFCYQTTALPPSQHGWIHKYFLNIITFLFDCCFIPQNLKLSLSMKLGENKFPSEVLQSGLKPVLFSKLTWQPIQNV